MWLFLCQYHTVLITIAFFTFYLFFFYSFVLRFEITKSDTSRFCLLSQACFGYLESFVAPYKFLDFLLSHGWVVFHCNVYTTSSLPIHLLTDAWVASTFWLLWIILQWAWEYRYFYRILFIWLLWVFIAVLKLSLGFCSSLHCAGFSLPASLSWSTGSRPTSFGSCSSWGQ